MGNAIGKKEEESIDGGSVFPQGKVYQNVDCDLRIIRRLIMDRKVAPFYLGLSDPTQDAPEECPICFLNYPLNSNFARCCNQPLCSECLLQIRQPKTGGPACCPFCAQEDFGVVYFPLGSEQRAKLKGKVVTFPPNAPNVVTIDHLRPNGRHHPPPPPVETTLPRRATISGRPRNAASRRTNHVSSSFSGDPFEGHSTTRIRSPSRFTARDIEAEIENLMLAEAIRLSLAEQEKGRSRSAQNQLQAVIQEPDSSDSSDDNGEPSSSPNLSEFGSLSLRERGQGTSNPNPNPRSLADDDTVLFSGN